MSTWVLAGLVLTGAWTQLDELGLAGWLPLAAMLALDRAAATRPSAVRPRLLAAAPLPLAFAALLCALILAHVGLTAREEFGFGGDEGYHLSATRAFALYYMRAGPILAGVLAAFAFWRWRGWPYASSVAVAGLIAGSALLPESPLFARYPTGFYHLALPFAVLFEVAGIPYPLAANHLVNALSVPAWLFLLRPLTLGRWPDWQVLPVALLVYFQPPALTYTASALLEPWAFVFLLLALEAVVALDPDRRWIAVPLAAAAAFFKETAILLLPTVWLVACVEWRGVRPALRTGAIALGAACAMPFLVYYSVRRGLQVDRTFELAATADIWTRARLDEWFANVRAQIGTGGLLAVGVATAAAVRQWWWLITALAIAVFFFADAASVPYTGYGRFAAYTLLAIGGGVFGVTHAWSHRRTALIALSAVIAALQLGPFWQTMALDFRPDYERNSLEWRGSLIRLPIRALIDRLPEARDAHLVRRVRIISFGPELISVPVAYPDLASRYELTLDQQRDGAVDCRCRDNAEAVLAGFEWPAHFDDTPANRSRFEQVSAACIDQIKTTCASMIAERHAGGAAVGALGVGRVALLALPQHHESPQR